MYLAEKDFQDPAQIVVLRSWCRLGLNVSVVGIQKLHYGHQQSLILHTCWVNLEKPTKNRGTKMEGNLDENKLAIYYTVYVGADLKT